MMHRLPTNKSVTTPEDTAIRITLGGSDVDSNDLIYTVVAAPSSGELSGIAPNLVYTPDADFNGEDGLTFVISDGNSESSVARVTITVTPVNDPPHAYPDSLSTHRGRSTHNRVVGR